MQRAVRNVFCVAGAEKETQVNVLSAKLLRRWLKKRCEWKYSCFWLVWFLMRPKKLPWRFQYQLAAQWIGIMYSFALVSRRGLITKTGYFAHNALPTAVRQCSIFASTFYKKSVVHVCTLSLFKSQSSVPLSNLLRHWALNKMAISEESVSPLNFWWKLAAVLLSQHFFCRFPTPVTPAHCSSFQQNLTDRYVSYSTL